MFKKPSDHPKILNDKIGVLLINLGTPNNTDTKSIRVYLKEFLSDPRVIDVPRILWWFILNLIILNTRPKKLVQHIKVSGLQMIRMGVLFENLPNYNQKIYLKHLIMII